MSRLTREELLAELLMERYAPRPLPPAAAPHPVQRALEERAAAAGPVTRSTVRARHLVLLDGGHHHDGGSGTGRLRTA